MGLSRNKWLLRLLTLAVITHSIDLKAQVITDLPDPDMHGAGFDVPALPEPPIAPPVQTVQTGWTMLEKISRRSGGDLFTIRLQKAVPLMRLEIRVDQSKVDILETTLIMQSGQRIAVRELTRTGVVERGTTRASENLNLSEAIAAIEIRMESHSAEATVLFSALSNHEYPRLTATRAVVNPPAPVETQTKTPAAPPAPTAPKVTQPTSPAAPDKRPTGSTPSNFVLKTGDRVLSNGEYTGVIVGKNKNGTYQVRDDDDGKIYTRKGNEFVTLVDSTDDGMLRKGVKVLSSNEYPGVVMGIFSDGRILIKDDDDGKEYGRKRDIVAYKVKCDRTGVFCEGTRVISSGQYKGQVIEVYSNGSIFVRDDDDRKMYIRNANLLVLEPAEKKCDSKGKNCKGTRVFSAGQYHGVVAYYSGTKIVVRDDDDGKLYERTRDMIAFETPCAANKNYCEGRRVLSGEYTGVVVRTYEGGIVLVRDDDDGKLYTRNPSIMAYEVKCLTNGICAGSRVLAVGQYKSKVLNVYSNNTVRMRDEDDNKVYFRPLTSVRLLK